VALPRVRADEGMRLEEKAKVPGVEGKADGAMIETEESLYVKARAANVILRYFSKQQGMYWVAQTEVKRLLTEYLLIPNKDDNAKDEMVVRINNAVKRQTKFSADLIKLLLNTIDIHFNLLTFFLNPDVRSMRGYNALSEVIAKLEKAGPWVAQPEIKEFISSYLLNSPKSIKYKSFFAEYIFYAMRGVKPSRDIPPLMLHAAEAMFQRLTVIDDAMTSRGGIDLKSANLAMTIKRDGNGIPIISQQDLAQISSNLEGLGPVILSIKPASQTTLFAELVTHP